jgi:hypothetical protein
VVSNSDKKTVQSLPKQGILQSSEQKLTMVERPIKKSERQPAPADDSAISATSEASEASEANAQPRSAPPPPTRRSSETREDRGEGREDRGDRRDDRGDRRSSGKGRRNSQDEPKQAVNLALMRGPKPVKPVAPAPEPEAIEPEAETEVVSEETQVEVAE